MTSDSEFLIKIAGFFVALVAAVVVINKFFRDQTVAKALKTVDVVMHCANRYTELSKLKNEISKLEREAREKKSKAEGGKEDHYLKLIVSLTDDYYRQFWALKSDQFDFWLNGVLDHDSFFDWSSHLVQKIAIELKPPTTKKESEADLAYSTSGLIHSWKVWTGRDSKDNGINHGGVNPRFMRFTDQLFGYAKESAAKQNRLEEVVNTSRAVLKSMEQLEGESTRKSDRQKLFEKFPRFHSLAAKNAFRIFENDLDSARSWRRHFWRGMSFYEFKAYVENDIKRMVADAASKESN